jgi:hypothetical protein
VTIDLRFMRCFSVVSEQHPDIPIKYVAEIVAATLSPRPTP